MDIISDIAPLHIHLTTDTKGNPIIIRHGLPFGPDAPICVPELAGKIIIHDRQGSELLFYQIAERGFRLVDPEGIVEDSGATEIYSNGDVKFVMQQSIEFLAKRLAEETGEEMDQKTIDAIYEIKLFPDTGLKMTTVHQFVQEWRETRNGQFTDEENALLDKF